MENENIEDENGLYLTSLPRIQAALQRHSQKQNANLEKKNDSSSGTSSSEGDLKDPDYPSYDLCDESKGFDPPVSAKVKDEGNLPLKQKPSKKVPSRQCKFIVVFLIFFRDYLRCAFVNYPYVLCCKSSESICEQPSQTTIEIDVSNAIGY